MLNILSYVGMSLQSEVCLWTLLGLLRTIFDATLFKVNANLKQVWQMNMPDELSKPVQRILRTMISGVMLAQCFTVYVYLATYIVLLYPVFLEERPTLVLPWLLIAAIRKLLCEMTSLALGLGACVLLGPARPPCIKFLTVKVTSIIPALYMWILIFNYYRVLKVAATFKTFPAVLPSSDHDYGLELAVRRRKTKSLLKEDQLRKRLVSNFYGERSSNSPPPQDHSPPRHKTEQISRMVHSTETLNSEEMLIQEPDILRPTSACSRLMSDPGTHEDWFGSEVVVPRDTDRILEQFVLMMLRIGVFLQKDESTTAIQLLNFNPPIIPPKGNIDTQLPNEDTDTPPLVGSQGKTASYLSDYPQIFNKKPSEIPLQLHSDGKVVSTEQYRNENENRGKIVRSRKRAVYLSPSETTRWEVEEIISHKTYQPHNNTSQDKVNDNFTSTNQKVRMNTSDNKIETINEESSIIKTGSRTEHLNGLKNVNEDASRCSSTTVLKDDKISESATEISESDSDCKSNNSNNF